MATVRFHYPQDADTLYRFVTDPEAVKARSIALGERDVRVTKSGETITNVRLVESELPSFAKNLFKPTNTVEEVKAWDAAKKTAKLSVDVKGAPTKVSGTIAIVASGSGCDYVVDFQVKCSIPLIGGKIEAFATGETEKGLRAEYEYTSKALAAK